MCKKSFVKSSPRLAPVFTPLTNSAIFTPDMEKDKKKKRSQNTVINNSFTSAWHKQAENKNQRAWILELIINGDINIPHHTLLLKPRRSIFYKYSWFINMREAETQTEEAREVTQLQVKLVLVTARSIWSRYYRTVGLDTSAPAPNAVLLR